MVDTSAKPLTTRRATASARVAMSKETVAAIRERRTPKGDPLETARALAVSEKSLGAEHPQTIDITRGLGEF